MTEKVKNVKYKPNKKNHIKTSVGSIVFDTINSTFMIVFCITILFPVWDTVVRSFSDPDKINYLALNLWPNPIVTDSYLYILSTAKLYRAFAVSVARASLGTILHLMCVSMCAFSLTAQEMPFKKLISLYFIFPMYFGGGLIPSYINIKNLGLFNTFFVYVIPGCFSTYNCLIVRNYMMSIDPGFREAADIDGASIWQILFKIIIPLSKPVLATVGLWQLVGHWNNWFDCMIYITNDKLITLQYMLRQMIDKTEQLNNEMADFLMMIPGGVDFTPESVKAAVTMVVIIPVMIVYPFIQKYFVGGIMLGGVKG